MDPITIVVSIIILLFSVVIHEVAHGYAAESLGDPTARMQGRLTLNPLKHIDPIGSIAVPLFLVLMQTGLVFGWAKPVPFNLYNIKNQRWGPALIAAAGPASNFALAIIFGLLLRFGGFLALPEAMVALFTIIVVINLVLGFFNLIPIPPLDGHHILFSLLPPRYNHIKRIILRNTLAFFLVFLFLIFVLGDPITGVVNWSFHLITGGALGL